MWGFELWRSSVSPCRYHVVLNPVQNAVNPSRKCQFFSSLIRLHCAEVKTPASMLVHLSQGLRKCSGLPNPTETAYSVLCVCVYPTQYSFDRICWVLDASDPILGIPWLKAAQSVLLWMLAIQSLVFSSDRQIGLTTLREPVSKYSWSKHRYSYLFQRNCP